MTKEHKISGNESRYYWMIVTRDKYELPLVVAESVAELAKMTGINPVVIRKGEHEGRMRGSVTKYKRTLKT